MNAYEERKYPTPPIPAPDILTGPDKDNSKSLYDFSRSPMGSISYPNLTVPNLVVMVELPFSRSDGHAYKKIHLWDLYLDITLLGSIVP